MRSEWRAEAMVRDDPVVTYRRRPSRPAAAGPADGVVLKGVATPYGERRAPPARGRSGAVTLAVVAGVAGIAASVAVVAATYDAARLEPQHAVGVGALAPSPVRPAASSVAAAPLVVASIPPAAARAIVPPTGGAAPIAPAAAVDDSAAAGAAPAGTSLDLPQAAATQPAEPVLPPPLPRLRPAVPPPPRAVAALPSAVPGSYPRPVPSWWTDGQGGSNDAGATVAAAPSPGYGGQGSNDTGGGGGAILNDPGSAVDEALKNVDRLLGALPPANVGTSVAAVTVIQPGARIPSAVPVPPAPPPAVIAGAPAVASSGQLLFALPDAVVVVPASVVRAPGGEVGPRLAHIVTPRLPLRPRLRRPLPEAAG